MYCRVACFIDGGYLDKILQNQFGYAKIDYSKLAEWMADGKELLRTYYYNCLPHQSSTPTKEEAERYAGKERFYHTLKKLPRFAVRLGKLEPRGVTSDGRIIFEQKRVDTYLGVDIAKLCVKQQVTHIAILTGDSDFIPAVEVAKEEGIFVCLFHSALKDFEAHRELKDACDERIAITKELIDSIKR